MLKVSLPCGVPHSQSLVVNHAGYVSLSRVQRLFFLSALNLKGAFDELSYILDLACTHNLCQVHPPPLL